MIAWPQGGHSLYIRNPAGDSFELANVLDLAATRRLFKPIALMQRRRHTAAARDSLTLVRVNPRKTLFIFTTSKSVARS